MSYVEQLVKVCENGSKSNNSASFNCVSYNHICTASGWVTECKLSSSPDAEAFTGMGYAKNLQSSTERAARLVIKQLPSWAFKEFCDQGNQLSESSRSNDNSNKIPQPKKAAKGIPQPKKAAMAIPQPITDPASQSCKISISVPKNSISRGHMEYIVARYGRINEFTFMSGYKTDIFYVTYQDVGDAADAVKELNDNNILTSFNTFTKMIAIFLKDNCELPSREKLHEELDEYVRNKNAIVKNDREFVGSEEEFTKSEE